MVACGLQLFCGVPASREGTKADLSRARGGPRVIEVLRGLIHTALENIVLTNNNNNAVKNKLINDGVDDTMEYFSKLANG